jgi:hypothetical protein
MNPTPAPDTDTRLSILAVTQGQWGERISDNIYRLHPPTWTVYRWSAPRALPPVIDDAEEYLPRQLPRADLVLALGETAAVAQLIPDIVKVSGAKAVIAPIDRNESLPAGLAAQLQKWLADLAVPAVFPKPFCSLTETAYNFPPIVVKYRDPIIQSFARQFGRPRFRISVDDAGSIVEAETERDSACGCGRFVAKGLIGLDAAGAEYEAGMLHHHFPCLASMTQDSDYKDTLMHVSGYALREAVKEQIQDHLVPAPYFQPMGRVDSES